MPFCSGEALQECGPLQQTQHFGSIRFVRGLLLKNMGAPQNLIGGHFQIGTYEGREFHQSLLDRVYPSSEFRRISTNGNMKSIRLRVLPISQTKGCTSLTQHLL